MVASRMEDVIFSNKNRVGLTSTKVADVQYIDLRK